jgi:O-antigen/teichoic acid export membrane protein
MLKIGSLLSGSAVYLFSNIINAAIPFALLPVLTRYLEPSEYGQVAMFQILVGALAAVVGLNVAGATSRKYYDDYSSEYELKYFIAACMQILLVSGGIAFAAIYAFREQIAEALGLEVRWILWAVFLSSASVIIQIRLNQWQIRKKARTYGVMQVLQSALNMLLSLMFVIALLKGAEGRMAAQVWTAGVFALLALALLKRDRLFALMVWRPHLLKEALAFGVPLIPHVAGIFLLVSIDRFVINAELGLAQAGIYMVAVQLASAVAIVFSAVNNAYVPWLFEHLKRDQPEEKRLIVLYTYAWFALILFAAGLAFIFGPWIVALVAGPEYVLAGSVIGWLVLGQTFGGMYLMVTNYIFYSKRTGLLALTTITSGFLNVCLLILLIPYMGLVGASIAFTVAMAIRFLLTWWVAHLRQPMPWFSLRMASMK